MCDRGERCYRPQRRYMYDRGERLYRPQRMYMHDRRQPPCIASYVLMAPRARTAVAFGAGLVNGPARPPPHGELQGRGTQGARRARGGDSSKKGGAVNRVHLRICVCHEPHWIHRDCHLPTRRGTAQDNGSARLMPRNSQPPANWQNVWEAFSSGPHQPTGC